MPFSVKQLNSIKVSLASPEAIRSWSHGEILNSETINHRTQKPEPGGLFCEKIFGPAKDYECHCGRYKKKMYQGVKCEVCGVEVMSKQVRRERIGSIELATPCTHIWYLKGTPSRIALVLHMTPKEVEDIAYYSARACIKAKNSTVLANYVEKNGPYIDDATGRILFNQILEEILDKDGTRKKAGLSTIDPKSIDYERAKELIEQNDNDVFIFKSNAELISKYTGAEFGDGGDAIKKLLQQVDVAKEKAKVEEELKKYMNEKQTSSTKTKRNQLTKRLEVLSSFINSGNKPEWMVLDVLPVLPPDLRPLLQLDGGRFAGSDLNDLYRRVVIRNNALKKFNEVQAPSPMLVNQRRILQEAVDALIDNSRRAKPSVGTNGRELKSLSDYLKGKQGRFRQNLLGKRVDYSGRSVIAVGPDLKMYQCGLPREMAIQLLRPFIASILIKDGIVTAHKQADKLINQYDAKVYEILEEIIDQHPVLLNRAPTLHRLGIQAFQPKLVDGRAIRLHPLVCAGFNADFDGDQMAVHVPLSKAAQEEAYNLMLASNNILGPKDGKPIVSPSQDMILGNYFLTLEEDKEGFLSKAKDFEKYGDKDSVELFEKYAAAEGKVFGSVDEVEAALERKVIHVHSRIGIIGRALKKVNFTEEMNKSYLITTAGKVIFNKIFPSDFPYLNDLNPDRKYSDPFTCEQERFFAPKGTNIPEYIAKQPLLQPFKKKDFGHIVNAVFTKYGTSKTSAILDKIKDIGFLYSTKAGITFSLFDMKVVETKKAKIEAADKKVQEIEELYASGELSENERYKGVCEVWEKCKDELKADLKVQLAKDKTNPLFFMFDSGARGSMDNFIQLEGIIGLMQKPNGDKIEIPIRSTYGEGVTVSEFFIGTHGARKGGADTALKTADSGYLTRRLVDVSQDVIVREEDCHTDHGFVVREILNPSTNEVLCKLEDRLAGRFSFKEIVNPTTGEVIVPADTLITLDKAKEVVAAGIKEVEIRSLLGCKTINGVCKHCYGTNLATGKVVEVGAAVGIMAAQSIGEPGTQLTMRTFHTGGVAGSDITQGLPRVNELVENRSPKGKATISKTTGTVTSIHPKEGKEGILIVEVKGNLKGEEVQKYEIAHDEKLLVKEGQEIKASDKITEGVIFSKDLLEATNIVDVENYLLREIRIPYFKESINISDKHLEIIIKQMLGRIEIIDSGDTKLVPGTRVSQSVFTVANQEVLLSGRAPAKGKPVILGIAKAALESDSFLSAASFQETTKVLTDAAIKGKTDKLHGLKENVISGKLIPAGRGLLTEEQSKDLLSHFDVEDKIEEVKQSYIEALDIVSK